MSLFRHSAKNFWIILKKILCRVPRHDTRQRNYIFFLKNLCRVPCPWHSAKTPRIAIFFTFHCNRQYIYIYINHHIYITNMHYISQAHAYLINPSKIHHKCTKVQHHKFIITSSTSQSSTSLLRWRRLQVSPLELHVTLGSLITYILIIII